MAKVESIEKIRKQLELTEIGSPKPVTLTESKFSRYRQLFVRDVVDSPAADKKHLQELVTEYLSEVNGGYSDVRVVSDSDPNEVILELPRLFTRLDIPSGKAAENARVKYMALQGNIRSDKSTGALVKYAESYLHAQDNDDMARRVNEGVQETERILKTYFEDTGQNAVSEDAEEGGEFSDD